MRLSTRLAALTVVLGLVAGAILASGGSARAFPRAATVADPKVTTHTGTLADGATFLAQHRVFLGQGYAPAGSAVLRPCTSSQGVSARPSTASDTRSA